MTNERRADASSDGLRIAVVGKGGVGKSTLTAMLARIMAQRGLGVIAVDADEQRNLAVTVGVDPLLSESIVPLAEQSSYIEEKTGSRPGEGSGGMVRLNPDTSDVVERLSVSAPDGVRLLVMGGVRRAGGGCLCPETALLAATIANMRRRDHEVVIMDTHAGVEHFGRALARGFSNALVVVEPTYNAVQVGLSTARMARDLDVATIDLVINGCRGDDDLNAVRGCMDRLGGFDFASVSTVPFELTMMTTEPSIAAMLEAPHMRSAVERLASLLLSGVDPQSALSPVSGPA
jgi:CO dehydrogenase maturation factor